MEPNDKSNDATQVTTIKKEPYEKPSFRCDTVFVTTALSCGKTPDSSFQCSINPKVS
jgi:hypothetical protein